MKLTQAQLEAANIELSEAEKSAKEALV